MDQLPIASEQTWAGNPFMDMLCVPWLAFDIDASLQCPQILPTVKIRLYCKQHIRTAEDP